MKLPILSLLVVLGVRCENESFNYDIEDYSPLRHINRVLVCFNEDTPQEIISSPLNIVSLFPDMSLEFHDVTDCLDEIENDKDGERSILAVVAPKPFKRLADTEVPIYFYEAPYFLEELEAYANAVTAVKDWRPLKYAFTHLFERQDWLRIAIISDESPYSAAFEEELVGHFNEQQLVYSVQRCVHYSRFGGCNFDEAVKFIKENRALIVVANIDGNSAQELVLAANAHGVTSRNKYVWLARDWPFSLTYEHDLSELGPIYSLTLVPKFIESLRFSSHGPHVESILQGLALLDDAVKKTERERIDLFYRDIANHMNTVINETYETRAFIRKMDVTMNSRSVITVMAVNASFITSYKDFKPFDAGVYDVEDCALMRSNVFTDPCNDFWIIMLVIVMLLFVLLFLLIIYINNCYLAYVEQEVKRHKLTSGVK